MDRYFYLASTLLTPVFGQKPPVSFEDLKETCSRLASAEDGAKLESLSLVPPIEKAGERKATFDFQERFWKRETVLRNEIAKQRAEKLSRKDEGQVRETEDWDNEAQASARRALSAEDPLQAEMSLEKDRWDWIDAQSTGHRFDSEALAAYALKILILERLARFTEEAGMERYESMYRTILSGSDKLSAFNGGS